MLIFEKKTYKEFLQSNEKISTNILADRLKKLVEQDVATKTVHPDNRLVFVYELTERGKALNRLLWKWLSGAMLFCLKRLLLRIWRKNGDVWVRILLQQVAESRTYNW